MLTRPAGVAPLLVVALVACGDPPGPSGGGSVPVVRFEIAPPASAADGRRVVVAGLAAETRGRLEGLAGNDPEWTELFPVYVGESIPAPGEDRPTLLGDYALEDGLAVFRPRFPWAPGQTYHAQWRPVPGELTASARVRIARPRGTSPTRVTAIYPSADELPENLLRLYVHFSAPMSRELAAEQVRLYGPEGAVEAPFVAAEHELWNRDRTRLTLFLDPGRIKRGVGPHEAHGPVLEAGREYELEIGAGFIDGRGLALAVPTRKRFRVGPADRSSPRPRSWRLFEPATAAEALRVEFSEPLDHALLGRSISVLTADGVRVEGEVSVGEGETSWSFRPASSWSPGTYRLRVDPLLEDPSGNSVRRPFDAPLEGRAGQGERPDPVLLEFRYRGSGLG